MRNIRKIVVHCTASPDDLDIGFKQINQWHKERGWASPSGVSCGYHYIIRRDGRFERGRPDHETGAHVRGNNSDSLGVVWVGTKYPSGKQYMALLELLRTLMKKYKLSILDIYGHSEFDDKKTCPNLDMNWLRAELVFKSDINDLANEVVNEVLNRP